MGAQPEASHAARRRATIRGSAAPTTRHASCSRSGHCSPLTIKVDGVRTLGTELPCRASLSARAISLRQRKPRLRNYTAPSITRSHPDPNIADRKREMRNVRATKAERKHTPETLTRPKRTTRGTNHSSPASGLPLELLLHPGELFGDVLERTTARDTPRVGPSLSSARAKSSGLLRPDSATIRCRGQPLAFSILRMSNEASMPSLMGIWMSIRVLLGGGGEGQDPVTCPQDNLEANLHIELVTPLLKHIHSLLPILDGMELVTLLGEQLGQDVPRHRIVLRHQNH
jgi:hypothetical protein